MSRRPASIGTLVGALLLLLSLSIPAAAITGGREAPDQSPYDAVGLLLLAYEDEADGAVFHVGFCSGTYVAADRYDHPFLTAAHCTFDADTYPLWVQAGLSSLLDKELTYIGMQVTFDAEPWLPEARTLDEFFTLDGGATTVPVAVGESPLDIIQTIGGFGAHPGRQDDRDIALLSLDDGPPGDVEPVDIDTDCLTTLSRQQLRQATWVSVGYGETYDRAPGAPERGPGGTRMVSEAPDGFLSLRPGGLFLFQNQARGHGGTCYGDSGGPIFLDTGDGESLKLVAITSWGDTNCMATNFTYRLDTDTAREVLFGNGDG